MNDPGVITLMVLILFVSIALALVINDLEGPDT